MRKHINGLMASLDGPKPGPASEVLSALIAQGAHLSLSVGEFNTDKFAVDTRNMVYVQVGTLIHMLSSRNAASAARVLEEFFPYDDIRDKIVSEYFTTLFDVVCGESDDIPEEAAEVLAELTLWGNTEEKYLANDGKCIKELVSMLGVRHTAQAACVLEVLGEFDAPRERMLAEGYVPGLIKLLKDVRYHTQAHDCFKELLFYDDGRDAIKASSIRDTLATLVEDRNMKPLATQTIDLFRRDPWGMKPLFPRWNKVAEEKPQIQKESKLEETGRTSEETTGKEGEETESNQGNQDEAVDGSEEDSDDIEGSEDSEDSEDGEDSDDDDDEDDDDDDEDHMGFGVF
ncbi:hypothetical protein HWV62_12078 [Athelia sp. TMB]|nr:hypothetical protein HWV62_12078 [Athelia sp. TMB]